jgi:hypothetical protein
MIRNLLIDEITALTWISIAVLPLLALTDRATIEELIPPMIQPLLKPAETV